MSAFEYGIHCQPGDEKILVKNINSFLATLGYRKMSKSIPSGLRNPDRPDKEPRYSHYYRQFLKEHPRWYFDLYPNTDLNGMARFKEYPQLAWTLYASKTFPEQNSVADNASLDHFFSALVASIGFPVTLLHTYQQDENRL